ncbi:tetratricopeptide repeat protein [Tumidithrix elongata RA019]|uniref:Tetratricopeptide repeat protein n=1 Tax=Tumidithrix elongata BACA0141 TaxID=2716417 RepID=A0AAW9PQZ4_9CYAN|nr:tetratricopeptide repeat protein [Tumidithrix elongata RA019]
MNVYKIFGGKFAKDYIVQGYAKYELGDYQGAIADFTEVVRLAPNDSNAYYCRGNSKVKLGDYQGAIADFTEVIRLDPNDANAYFSRGYAKYELGDKKVAIADYNEAAQLFKQQSLTDNYPKTADLVESLYQFKRVS